MFLQVGTDAYLPQHRVLIKNRFPGLPRTTELEFPGVGWEQDYLQLHETRHMMRRGLGTSGPGEALLTPFPSGIQGTSSLPLSSSSGTSPHPGI